MTEPAALAARELACVRGGRRVLARLSFELGAGGALLLTGPNGSGKSTLLRCIAGLLPLAGGAVLWNGADVAADRAAHAARLAFVGHLDPVKPALSPAAQLAFWAALADAPRPDIAGALDRFGIAAIAAAPARCLSAGQRRRLNLARLLVTPARLWLLDEPATGLDAAAIAALEGALAAHLAGGGLAVIATHQPVALTGAATLDLAAGR